LSRRLSFQDIASYAPQTLVTDHVSHNSRWARVRLFDLSPSRLLSQFCLPYSVIPSIRAGCHFSGLTLWCFLTQNGHIFSRRLSMISTKKALLSKSYAEIHH
jgi:hypothetical protein